MLVVMVGWVCFRAENIFQARDIIIKMFTFTESHITVISFMSMKVILVFVTGILFSGILQRVFKSRYDKISDKTVILAIDYSVQTMVLLYSILILVSGTYNPFIYFQF